MGGRTNKVIFSDEVWRSSMTLICDASYCKVTKVSGWACWMKRDGFGFGRFGGGQNISPLPSSSVAELYGINQSVILGAASGLITTDLDFLMIQCDNLRALGVLMTTLSGIQDMPYIGDNPTGFKQRVFSIKEEKILPEEREMVAAMRMLLFANPAIIIGVRHIKGHSIDMAGRTSVQRECDERAYENMKRAKRMFIVQERDKRKAEQERERYFSILTDEI